MTKLLKIGILILTLTLSLVAVIFYLKVKKSPEPLDSTGTKNQLNNGEVKKIAWIKFDYNDRTDLRFTMKAPNDLALNKDGENGNYVDFVRFQEVKSSQSSGINVGIRENSLDKEIVSIKKELEENGVLVDEKPIVFNGFPARRLHFRPKSNEGFEERVVVVSTKGKYAISISTSPAQVDQVLANFKYSN